jgi:hypothetical protein
MQSLSPAWLLKFKKGMLMNRQLEKAIEDMLPKSVDDIIRVHRDRCSIRLVGNQELMSALPSMVSKLNVQKPVKAILDDWRIICVTLDGKCLYFLIGKRHDRGGLIMTSNVNAVDFASNKVLTNNSVYQLGARGNDKPDTGVLLHICATLRSWGFGAGFGVPAIFY